MRTNRWLVPLFAFALVFVGCSDDEDNGPKNIVDPTTEEAVITVVNSDSSKTSRINATDYDSYTYLNLETGEEVVLTGDEAVVNSDWHVAFSRINGKLNGGVSGPAGVVGVDLEDVDGSQGVPFEDILTLPTVADGDWVTDENRLIVDDLFYHYNPVNHSVEMTENIFVLYTVDGKYCKFYVSGMEGAGMPPNLGQISVTYVYQADGTTDLSATPQVLTVDGTDGTAYVSFAQGGEVNVTDPMSNSTWDICFFFNTDGEARYSVKANSGISGSGSVGIYPMYLEEDDFAAVDTAPPPGGYFTDNIESIFGAPTVPGSEWYNYDMNLGRHEIISKEHVYLVKVSDTSTYKLMITNYYHPETGLSGYVSLRYKQL